MFFKPDNITIMQLYLDSANPEEILLAREWGVIDGVTTNLSLVAKSGVKMEAAIGAVLNASPGPVYCQVVGWKETAPLVAQARWLHRFSRRIVVKIPMGIAGITAVRQLKRENPRIPLCVTVVSSVAQAVLVAKAGADVVALFNGPLDLEQDEPVNTVSVVRAIYDRGGYATKILSAGRFPRSFGEYAADGSDIITIRMEFMKQLFEHSFTDKRMRGFLGDWQTAYGDKTWPSRKGASTAGKRKKA
jgi:transaldolase